MDFHIYFMKNFKVTFFFFYYLMMKSAIFVWFSSLIS